MALLKTKDIRAMRPEDLRAKFKELSDELMHERGVAAMGGAPRSPGKIRALRTNIARIHTVMHEAELAERKKAGSKKASADEGGKPKKEKKGPKEKARKRPPKEEKK